MEKHTTDGAGTPEDGVKPEKVAFTPEQQAKIQELIDATYRRAYAKASEGVTSKEVEQLRGEIERLKPLAAGKETLDAELGQVAEQRKELSIRLALSRHDVVDPDAAVRLINEHVGFADGRTIAYGADGEPALDEAGTEMTLDAYVEGFLRDKTYLLRSTPTTGAGSHVKRGSLLNSDSMRRDAFDELSPREKTHYISGGGSITD